MTPNDGAVIKEPHIQEEVGTFLLNAGDEWLEDDGEEERSEGVTLLGTGRAEQVVAAEEEMRGCTISELYPG